MSEFKTRLNQTRKRLLDLSRRNKLINYKKPSRGKYLTIIDESPEFIYQYLVFGEKTFRFKSIPEAKKTPYYRGLKQKKEEIKYSIYPNRRERLKRLKKSFLLSNDFAWREASAFDAVKPHFIDYNLKRLESSVKKYLSKKILLEEEIIDLKAQRLALKIELEEIEESEGLGVEVQAKKLGLDVSSLMPEIDFIDSKVDSKHKDLNLQTLHFPSELDSILHKTELASNAIIQESGSNMLYLVLGVLEWRDRDNSSTILKSPIITVPVQLKRNYVHKKSYAFYYTLQYNGDLITVNESLKEKLKNDFSVDLPELSENISFNNYVREVQKLCTQNNGWKIRQEIALDFLQFGKILMYKDLNPIFWKQNALEKNQVLNDLFLAKHKGSVFYAPQEYDIDHHKIANTVPLVLDADSSQHSAIIDVLEGKNVVIEGPPGTGKSQIIANLVAGLMSQNKSVLFVSEKLVALEVVYQRLEKIGLGSFCLELHSHKSEKKKVFENLKQRVEGVYPFENDIEGHKRRLMLKKEKLRAYLDTLHTSYGKSDKTFFEIFWELEGSYEAQKYLKFKIKNVKNLTPSTVLNCKNMLIRYKNFHESYDLKNYFWKGLVPKKLDFFSIDTVVIILNNLNTEYTLLDKVFQGLNIEVKDEFDEALALGIFYKSFSKEEAYYFDYEHISEFRLLHEKLKNYLETYKEFTLLSDFESIETADIIRSLKPALNILKQLSEFQSELKEDIEDYRTFIVESEKNYDEFKAIEERSSVHFNPMALHQKRVDELLEIALSVNDKRDSFFRFLFANYRKNIKKFEYLLNEPLPDNHSEWIVFLRDLNLYALNRDNQLKLRRNLKIRIDVFIRNISKMYKAIERTLNSYDAIENASIDNSFKKKLFKDKEAIELLIPLLDSQKKIEKQHEALAPYALLEKSFFKTKNLSFSEVLLKLKSVERHKSTLSLWNDFNKESQALKTLGLGAILSAVDENRLPLDRIVSNFSFNYYNSLLMEGFKSYPLFDDFSRTKQDWLVEEFRHLDVELLELNKKYIAHKVSQRKMPLSRGKGSVKTFTNLKLIQHEIGKKIRHVPIRELIQRAGSALQSLKPCFMMSPLSVSQYLPPKTIDFDVLLIDEASQLRPEESLGVIARAKQVVIVGDPKQLPPTSFFQSSKEISNEEESIVDDSESILESCIELYNPVRRLKWHYRSQHESLIDFSNKHFYDNDLIIFPSPSSIKSDAFGVKYTYIEDGYYQGGANYRYNEKEAEVLVEHVEKQIAKYPKKSLGIGTFNNSQREYIQKLIDEREKVNEQLALYIEYWSSQNEPFFVKNLESLQGDERDVVFISTTYGKSFERKKVMQRFGPINQESGWRRLNVLVSRSKQKMHVFTSMLSSDITVSQNSSKGVIALRDFLKFLEQGGVSHKENNQANKGSLFANAIAKILQEKGIKTVSNIGVSGYFIDLAVLGDNGEDAILAIECDGENYYASKSASDRDRLKDEVLKRLGWKTYRIWSVDWYKNRENEIEKLLELIEISKKV